MCSKTASETLRLLSFEPDLVHCHRSRALLLGLGQCGGNILESREMLVDIGFRVLYRNCPLLIPPVRLSHDAAINHAEPVVSPEIDINRQPISVVANLLWT